MITVKNVGKIIGNEYLFSDISFTINDNDKIGIVGRNGVGKTTLLKILENEEYATDGEVIYSNQKVAFLSQEKNLNLNNTLNDEIKLLMSQFVNLRTKMDEILKNPNFSDDWKLIEEYGNLENKFNLLGGYEIEAKVKRVLAVFGFSNDKYEKKIADFSGGEKTRLALVKIILSEPDYLILDEPTNHLDMKTIEWLEDFLRTKAKGVVVVSHDRFFLQRVCKKIYELNNGKLYEYNTNYSNYLKERVIRYELQLKTYENQLKEINRLQEFIDKNKLKDSKIGQVNDRKRKIESIELVDKPIYDNEKINFTIEGYRNKKANYVDLLNCTIGYDKPLIKDVNLTIRGGDKIGIIGENGAGKSTLIKTMTREIKPFSGRAILHPKIKIGYFEQEQDSLNTDLTVYETIEKLMPGETKTMIRKHLAQFLFKGNDVKKKVSVLSGGEKVRLIFAKFVLDKYDMIILDEPTNHLDVSAKSELENVLKQYPGTLLVISHDRFFLNEIINKVFLIENDNYQEYEGNYEEYLEQKEAKKEQKISVKTKKIKQVKKTKKNTKKIENKINELEEELLKCTELVQTEEVYSNYQLANEMKDKISAINNELEKLYEKLVEGE